MEIYVRISGKLTTCTYRNPHVDRVIGHPLPIEQVVRTQATNT